jgi:hypothetical protein
MNNDLIKNYLRERINGWNNTPYALDDEEQESLIADTLMLHRLEAGDELTKEEKDGLSSDILSDILENDFSPTDSLIADLKHLNYFITLRLALEELV